MTKSHYPNNIYTISNNNNNNNICHQYYYCNITFAISNILVIPAHDELFRYFSQMNWYISCTNYGTSVCSCKQYVSIWSSASLIL